MTVTYCAKANEFLAVAAETAVTFKNGTPLAMDIQCPDCTRVFKSLPLKRKDMTVWVSIHAMPKAVVAQVDNALARDGGSAVLENDTPAGPPAEVLDGTPSASAAAMENAAPVELTPAQQAIVDAVHAEVAPVATPVRRRKTRAPLN